VVELVITLRSPILMYSGGTCPLLGRLTPYQVAQAAEIAAALRTDLGVMASSRAPVTDNRRVTVADRVASSEPQLYLT
jgi:hypothetical protein